MMLNGPFCADVPLRNCSLTHSLFHRTFCCSSSFLYTPDWSRWNVIHGDCWIVNVIILHLVGYVDGNKN